MKRITKKEKEILVEKLRSNYNTTELLAMLPRDLFPSKNTIHEVVVYDKFNNQDLVVEIDVRKIKCTNL